MAKKETKNPAPSVIGINVEGISEHVLGKLTASIVEILSLKDCGDAPKSQAMETLRVLVKPTAITVSNNTIAVGKTP